MRFNYSSVVVNKLRPQAYILVMSVGTPDLYSSVRD